MCGGAGIGGGLPGRVGPKAKRPSCMLNSAGGNRQWLTSTQDSDYKGVGPSGLRGRRGGGTGHHTGGLTGEGGPLLVTGSRGYNNRSEMRAAIIRKNPTYIIHGGARGADSMAEDIALELGIPTRIYDVNWRPGGVFNNRAGFERNSEMLWHNRNASTAAFFDRKITGGTGDTLGKSVLMGQGIIPGTDIFGIAAADLARQGLKSVSQALQRFLGGW